jgi:hypothetical protein
MNIERVRSILGVWAPMAIGLFIIVTSINFYRTAELTNTPVGNLDSWRLVCSAGAFFVGGVLMLSTYGRYRKTKEARREMPAATSRLPSTTPPHDDADTHGDHDD